jgi:hypothetical protein
VCLAQHRAVSGPEADQSAQSERLPAAAWSSLVARCAVARQPEECRLRVVRAPYARAETYRRAACLQVVSSEQQSAARVVAACESARLPVASVPSALRVVEAAEVAEPLALRRAAARVEAAVAEAVGPHEEAAALHGEVGVAEVPPASVVEERQAVPEPRRAARPSAAAPSSPSRLRSAPARRSAVTTHSARAPPRYLQIASP